MAMLRAEILDRLQEQLRRGLPIIGAGAGTGISGKCAEAGGADLIVIYNSGRFRMAGHSSLSGMLPFGDANAIVVDMAREVLPTVRRTPVLAGVCGTDPFRMMEFFLPQLKAMGFQGVQNFPTVGLFDGQFRQSLEETGLGYGKEVEMIAIAHRLDLLTTPYVFNPEESIRMAQAGADVIVAHMGLTTKGMIGARTAKTIEQCATEVQAICDAAKSVRKDILVICHGGPISEPEDAAWIISNTKGIAGFFGASSIERLPTEGAITQQVKAFKAMNVKSN
jgi:predicted TIM-barrel enzyme